MDELNNILSKLNEIIKRKDVESEEIELLSSHLEVIEEHISLNIKPKEELLVNLNKILNLYKV